jgi:ketosteroid isomerase-like protein
VSADVEVVVGTFESANERDFAAAMDAYAEDVTLILHELFGGGPLGDETVTGKTAVAEWFGDWFRQFGPDYRFEIEESRGRGESVFIVATHHGRGRQSGAPVEQRLGYVYTVREGKINGIEVWADHEAALRAFSGD